MCVCDAVLCCRVFPDAPGERRAQGPTCLGHALCPPLVLSGGKMPLQPKTRPNFSFMLYRCKISIADCDGLASKFRTLWQLSPAGKKQKNKLGRRGNHSRSSTTLSSLPVRGAPKQPYDNRWERDARSPLTEQQRVLCEGLHRPSCI